MNWSDWLNWLPALHRPGLGLLFLAVGLVCGPVVLLLLVLRRSTGGVQPVRLGQGGHSARADPPLVRLVLRLFGGTLVRLGQWYQQAPRERLEERLAWIGLEQVPVGAWLALQALLGGAGMLVLLLGALVLGVEVRLGLLATGLAGFLLTLAPNTWLEARVRERNALHVQQVVPWLQEVATLLGAGFAVEDALRDAIFHQRQVRAWPRLQYGRDLFDELELALSQLAGVHGTLADALAEVQARCPQPQVSDALEEARLALASGARLNEALTSGARAAEDTIDRLLLSALERRIPVVSMATLIAAFLLYAGTIFGVIGLDLVSNLANLH